MVVTVEVLQVVVLLPLRDGEGRLIDMMGIVVIGSEIGIEIGIGIEGTGIGTGTEIEMRMIDLVYLILTGMFLLGGASRIHPLQVAFLVLLGIIWQGMVCKIILIWFNV